MIISCSSILVVSILSQLTAFLEERLMQSATLSNVVIRKRGADSVGRLPAGEGWMFVELAGEDPAEVRDRAEALLAEVDTRAGWIVEDQLQILHIISFHLGHIRGGGGWDRTSDQQVMSPLL